ncbi:MAG: hypothetical protein ACK4M9_01980 [Anaerobacillus sp.]|uniref:restriction endonuclease-related protein n=1 Tax=Anaerobacillus sp. TaxID=1872506 RepID=UPI00391B32DC
MQINKRELREMLFCLIEGIKQWEKDYTKVPDKLYKGHMLYMKHKAMINSNIPNNLFDLIKLLKKPSSEWGIPQLEDIFSPEARLIEPFNGITTEAEEFIHSYQSLDETDQSVMRNIFGICREQELDNEYRFIRTFLSNSANAVINSFSLAKILAENLESQALRQLVYECYEALPEPVSNYRKCPHCGWTLQYRNGNWFCNKENVCHKIESFEHTPMFSFNETDKVYRLTSGIQRYILLPGLQEIRFSNLLDKKGYQVTTYPDIDMYDIRINLPEKIIDLDMKDYKSTSILADYFNQLPVSQLEKYHSNSFIVIPSYRIKFSPAYIKIVNSRLDESVKRHVRILSENQVIKLLKEELK